MRRFSDTFVVLMASALVLVAVIVLACCTCFAQEPLETKQHSLARQVLNARDSYSRSAEMRCEANLRVRTYLQEQAVVDWNE